MTRDPATKAEWLASLREQQRKTVAPYSLLAILLGLALAGALWSGRVYGDSFRSPRGEVVLVRHQEPCDDAAILLHLQRGGLGRIAHQFKRATLTYGGRDWKSCWIEVGEWVYSVDEEGSPLERIPVDRFKDDPGA